MRRYLPRLALAVAVVAAAVWLGLNGNGFDQAAFDAWLGDLGDLGAWAPAAFVALYAVATVLFVPGSLISLAGGAAFGPVWGAFLNLLGAGAGAGAAFLVARYVAGDWLARKAAGRAQRLFTGVESEGWRFVAFVRLVPLFPFNLVNYLFGLTRIGFVPYIVTSLVCMVPAAVAYTWLGHAGRAAVAGDASAIRYGLLALGLIAAIAFVPRLARRLRSGPAATPWIDADALHARLQAVGAPTVLDVRGADEFAGELGHIPGAVNIPLADLDRRVNELRQAAGVGITVVCRTDKRSAVARTTLDDAGFRDVTVLRGGMERWNACGFAVARGEPYGTTTAKERPS